MVHEPSAFGAVLRRFRAAAALSQEALAVRAGLSLRGISDLERGIRRAPHLNTVGLLADALGLSPEDRQALLSAARPDSSIYTLHVLTPLPQPLTSLIGREREVATLISQVGSPDARLVTVTGPGGTGKTRLALEVGTQLWSNFDAGVVFVDLTPLRDAAFVIPTIAAAFGVRERPDQPLRDTLARFLAAKHLLLLLDNCEQVLAAAADVAALLLPCPRMAILATSREALRVRGEREFPLLPLPLPEADHLPSVEELAQVPAVALFATRAAASHPDFALTQDNAATVAAICRRLDGLPLAIELAAARIKVLSPVALLARLERRLPMLTGGARDLPLRQRTLRDTIGWSYDLLSLEEQTLFRRLGVFAGGWTLDSAEAVTNPDGTLDVFDCLVSLVDKHLVRSIEPPGEDPRFTMLETIREFGLEQLAASAEAAAVRRAHAAWCVALAERAESELWGPGQTLWLARLKSELDNLRAALRWAEERGDDELILRLGGLLGIFWQIHGHAAEGARWVNLALARDAPVAPDVHAHALFASGLLGWVAGDYTRGAERCAASTELWRTLGDTWHAALALNVLGMLRGEQGDHVAARRDLEESLAMCRDIGHEWGIGLGLFDLGKALTYVRAYEESGPLIEESLAHFEVTGDRWQMAEALADLGGVAQVQGDVDRVAQLAAESLRLNREQGWLWYVPEGLELLGGVALARGEVERAARLLGAAEARRDATGAARQPVFRDPYTDHVAAARVALGNDAFATAWSAGQGMSLDDAVKDALVIAAVPIEGSGAASSA